MRAVGLIGCLVALAVGCPALASAVPPASVTSASLTGGTTHPTVTWADTGADGYYVEIELTGTSGTYCDSGTLLADQIVRGLCPGLSAMSAIPVDHSWAGVAHDDVCIAGTCSFSWTATLDPGDYALYVEACDIGEGCDDAAYDYACPVGGDPFCYDPSRSDGHLGGSVAVTPYDLTAAGPTVLNEVFDTDPGVAVIGGAIAAGVLALCLGWAVFRRVVRG